LKDEFSSIHSNRLETAVPSDKKQFRKYEVIPLPMNIETKKISLNLLKSNKGQIAGLPKNPRIIKDNRYELLVKSITEDPEMLNLRELIVYPLNGDFIVIAGNQRLEALKKLKFKEAPCKVLSADTPVEKLQAYAIKDNISFGAPDYEALANEWPQDKLADWGVEISGFEYPQSDDFDENNLNLTDEKMIIITGNFTADQSEEIQTLCNKFELKCRIRN